MSGADKSEAIQAAIDVVGKDAYNEELLKNGAASADRWAYETAQKANFRSGDVVIDTTKTSSTPQHTTNEKVNKSNETINRVNEPNKEHSNEKRANNAEISNTQRKSGNNSDKK